MKVKPVLVEFTNWKELKIYKPLGFMLYSILGVKTSQAQVLVGEN